MNIVREEMDRAGGQEVLMPIIQPAELWQESGRWVVYGDEMFRLKDRHNRSFALGPTHEEIITTIVKQDVHSYRDLPLLLYQIQNKYRDEIRPRFGLMRGREFIMKDLYSFDMDEAGLDLSYKKMHEAYKRIFERMNLKYRVVEADSGAIGGNESHEFMVLASSGEAQIVYCDNCHYAANVEKAQCQAQEAVKAKSIVVKALEKIHTPGVRTVDDVMQKLAVPIESIAKTLIYWADGEYVGAVIRGDRELNEIKFKNILRCNELVIADEKQIREVLGISVGSLGPIGAKFKVYADQEIEFMDNFICGANEDGYHLINVNMSRDFVPETIADLRNAVKGDSCPVCSAELDTIRGIEVGHIFKLGTKYSEVMKASFLDNNGQEKPFIMGCYGIGVSRTMAAAVEQNHDENGIIWPIPIAPYQVIIVPVNTKKTEQMELAWSLYHQLLGLGLEVIIDDRDERAGVKFKDADLTGIPLRITIGPKALQEDKVELKKRWEKETVLVAIENIVEEINRILKQY
jgi:prolyl-tRNA synthetase